MAYGTPPIVSDTGGNPELVADGKNGFVTRSGQAEDIAQAILKLYRDPELRLAMGKASQERIDKEFNSRKTIKQTLRLYKEVMQEA